MGINQVAPHHLGLRRKELHPHLQHLRPHSRLRSISSHLRRPRKRTRKSHLTFQTFTNLLLLLPSQSSVGRGLQLISTGYLPIRSLTQPRCRSLAFKRPTVPFTPICSTPLILTQTSSFFSPLDLAFLPQPQTVL